MFTPLAAAAPYAQWQAAGIRSPLSNIHAVVTAGLGSNPAGVVSMR